MSSDGRGFIPCAECEWPELCEWEYACIARIAAENIRAETPPVYQCHKHPERETVSPHALRLCAECLDMAQQAYVDQGPREYRWSARDERIANMFYGGRTSTGML